MSEPIDFIRWGSIEGLHHVRSHLEKERDKITGELFAPYSVINAHSMTLRYRSKVKLHGMNCGIVINQGEIKLQSRNMFMDGSVQGNKQKGKFFGFDAWALKQKDFFLSLEEPVRKHLKLADDALITLFGEWCGPAVQKGVALSKLKKPIFVLFAVRISTNLLIVEPDPIQRLLSLSPKPLPADLHVLPWHEDYRMPEQMHREITLKFNDEHGLEAKAVVIQSMVVDIDREDPWVRRQFDVSGVGEGLVFYPINLIDDDGYIASEVFEAFSFKAKGASHQMTAGAQSKGIQLKTQTAGSPQEFSEMFLAAGRFSQGVTEITLGDMSALEKTKFIDWVVNDVKKESKIELEDSKLDWNDVEPLIRSKADVWFNENIKLSPHS